MDDADLYGEVAPVQVRRGKHHSGLVLFQDTVDYCYRFTVLHRSRTAQHDSDDDHSSIITVIVVVVYYPEAEWWCAGMVICLERGADLYMASAGSYASLHLAPDR